VLVAFGLSIALGPAPSHAQVQGAGPRKPESTSQVETAPEPGGFRAFFRDVGRDYRNFISVENAERTAVGGVAAWVIHSVDETIRSATQEPTPLALQPGGTYGNASFQFPLAVTWWIAGHAAGSAHAAEAGRDLLRAQISAASWTYAIKYAVNRTRPNGDPRSFPSGHASATFATAMVLQRHYGWKLGVPMFAAATYTAAERITENKHWASDVAFGAVVGM
jgi:membrane-associated phospholipid phosphatase